MEDELIGIKARRFKMYNLTTIDCHAKNENKLYNEWKNCKDKEEKSGKKEEYIKSIKEYVGIREVDSKRILVDKEPKESKMIAGFENECVRLSDSFRYKAENPKYIPFIPEIIVLDVYNEEILSQIIDNGLMVVEKKFIFYSSSANQQKKKQVCLMEENFYKKYESKLMCGLTLNLINNNERAKGCNIGKFLAYTSLVFSRSVELPVEISIDEVVVLPEFETNVKEKVNYLNVENDTLDVVEMEVPVNHMDGAGFFLPGVLPTSAQIRGGWIKGCVFPFDFSKFIKEKEKTGRIPAGAVIKDVWGNDVEITHIRDNVKLVLNGSQLKMWKYYKSFDEYKEKFKENGLKLCINNMLEYPQSNDPIVHSAYQFYQTIPRENVTDEKIEKLCQLTIEKITSAKTNPDAALEIMGISCDKQDSDEEVMVLDPLKACIKLYPPLLNDPYVRKRIDSNIKSVRKKAMSGKPLIKGFYNYICPDLYAACEYWFCGDKTPKGLIPTRTVYNKFYDDKEEIKEVCCLRSPHLSDCEHGIRELMRNEECKKWFHGMDTVISTHDLLTKTLQCDVDGDEMLITHDRVFIDLVDKDKSPLFYEMRKGSSEEVNASAIKACLNRSFENANIGEVSNAITKHLNLKAEPDLRFVKFMTAYNNFIIDHPKSQYMPELSNDYKEMFAELNSKIEKYPYFFKYAKDKKKDVCWAYDKEEKSNVNRISKYIEKQTSNDIDNMWKIKEEDSSQIFEAEKLMSETFKVERSSNDYKELCKVLTKLKKVDTEKFRRRLREKCKEKELQLLGYDMFYHYCCREIFNVIGIRERAATYLVDIEYFQPAFANTSKDILWNCFGDILFENLSTNQENPSDNVKIRRLAYQSRVDKELEIGKLVEQVKKELERNRKIDIYKEEFEWFTRIETKKDSQYDQYLLYLLLVVYKRKLNCMENISDEAKKYVTIHKNKRTKNKVTRATLDNWLERDIADKGLKRLEKKGLIKIIECKDYYKVYLKPKFSIELKREEKPLFIVGGANPMYYYYEYTGDRKMPKTQKTIWS